jgi:hypothetical protein
MPERPLNQFRPRLEGLETKQPLSASPSTAVVAARSVEGKVNPGGPEEGGSTTGLTLGRIINPVGNGADVALHPPYEGHVMVQSSQPVPGQKYNVLFVSIYNGTDQTFTASTGLTVRTSNSPAGVSYPVLTGNQVWKPGGRFVFYILSKSYYKLSPTQSAGFVFNLISPRVTAIPGPSGIFLRVKYNPATFLSQLDQEVTSGPGTYGHQFGVPDTALYAITPPQPHAENL